MNSFIKFFAYFIYILPRRLQLFIGDVIGFLWFDVFRIRRRVVLDNLRLAFPNWSETQRISVARASLFSVGRTLVEYAILAHFDPKKDLEKYFEFEGLENLEEAHAAGKGALILSLHTGNGDFACMGMSYVGYPPIVISKQFKSKWLNDSWFGLRRRHGTDFIREEKSSFDILKALKRNSCVIFVLDQFMGPPTGVKTKFFGVETGTAQGLAIFHQRTGAPVLPGYAIRLPSGKMKVIVEKPIPFEKKNSDEDTISFMTQRYTDKIEEIVQRYPGQWMWLHRRWKKFEVR